MTPEERKEKATELYNKLKPESGDRLLSDNPTFLSFQALVEFVKILADPDNEAFTQLDKGKFANPFTDETEKFAMAVHFAEHPLDDIEEELNARGIKEKVILRKITVPKISYENTIKEIKNNYTTTENPDGTITIEEYEEKPIHFEIKPLKDYAKEWMRKRVPVNRLRVHEIIDMAGRARIGDMARPEDRRLTQNPNQPQLRI